MIYLDLSAVKHFQKLKSNQPTNQPTPSSPLPQEKTKSIMKMILVDLKLFISILQSKTNLGTLLLILLHSSRWKQRANGLWGWKTGQKLILYYVNCKMMKNDVLAKCKNQEKRNERKRFMECYCVINKQLWALIFNNNLIYLNKNLIPSKYLNGTQSSNLSFKFKKTNWKKAHNFASFDF